jgi:hypothetical protein
VDSSVAAPILLAYALSQRGPRKHKRILKHKDQWTKEVLDLYKKRMKKSDK